MSVGGWLRSGYSLRAGLMAGVFRRAETISECGIGEFFIVQEAGYFDG